jgi:hypothetical protein
MPKYYSKTILSFSILIEEKRKRVVFSPLTNGGSVYITNDKKEIAVLESLDLFGRAFTKVSEPVNEAKEEIELVPVEEVATYQEAVNYLITHYDLKKTGLKTPDKILDAAAKVGISFPNITVE